MKLILIITALTSSGPVMERHTLAGDLGPSACYAMRDGAVVSGSSDVGMILLCEAVPAK